MVALFDLDGVIVDTEPSYGRFWTMMGPRYNIYDPCFANSIKGTTLTQILERHFPDEEMKKRVVEDLDKFEDTMEYPLFDHVLDFLSQLQEANIKCAIVTSSNLVKMNNLWKQHPHLRNYFEAVITDEDVTRSKPDPEPYIVAAHRLHTEPTEAWVFEDSYNGLKSGRASGAKVVALATTNPRDTLYDLADLVIDDFSQLTLADLTTEGMF